MKPFDLLGPLPARGSTTVLEASAGTGKTFALAGLVTRYLAEGMATLGEMLLITFSRAASRELRERVRAQIAEVATALELPPHDAVNDLVEFLLRGTDHERDARRTRLRDALANFDAATIVTTHEFCGIVLRSLGVAGDTDATVELVENLNDLVDEIVDDRYLATFGQTEDEPLLTHEDAASLARAVVNDPSAHLRPLAPDPGSVAEVRLEFARKVIDELELRKRRMGILGFDDLLSRLAAALEEVDAPARERMRLRWPIVMVDEFQDTDPIQWQVISRAFSDESTLILIGDPKQAIYAFRGGDIYTYLSAARSAGEQRTLGTNWRSDQALVESLHVVLGGAALGDPAIVVHDIHAHHSGHRLNGAPRNAPFRLRVVSRDDFGLNDTETIPIENLRKHIGADLAADIGELLASDATFDARPVAASDIAVIVEAHADARACRDALARAGIAAVYAGDADVFSSTAADDWLCLLEAFDQPQHTGLVRAAATTMFFGHTAKDLASEGDSLTDRVTDTLRKWTDLARERGVATVFEIAQLSGMNERVLSVQGGERHMTDLTHIAQLLQEAAHGEQLGLSALRDWLWRKREERKGASERIRRLDSDAAAVQIMTVHAGKGLQYPIVYLPFAFTRFVRADDVLLFHDENETRCLHIGGKKSSDRADVVELYRRESARNDIRLTYVALTRAQSQVVAWWAPNKHEIFGGLSRLLRGRQRDGVDVPDQCEPDITDDDALACFREWEAAGGPVVERSDVVSAPAVPRPPARSDLTARHFHRSIDTVWRRTSYSGLIRVTETPGVSSEPEVAELDDEVGDIPLLQPASGPVVPSPMADLPSGAKFGTLVHAVLETADPFAPDLTAELEEQVRTHSTWWPVNVPVSELAAALVPMHDTSLGQLAGGLTLRQIGLRDRLREMDFEFPLAGGDLRESVTTISLADVGRLLREHLSEDDPLAPYADRLMGGTLGGQSLRGYLTGSVDAMLRIPDGSGHRYIVVDYKTNWLGEADRRLTAADYDRRRLVEAMLHSDYPLQALLYSIVLHRFLRWRLPGYDPSVHLGGVLYLFVRGMCGADTPVVDGHPAGVFSWQPPAVLVTALSDLLDSRAVAA
jgi:exodeoxyribonuclease V beta subunit